MLLSIIIMTMLDTETLVRHQVLRTIRMLVLALLHRCCNTSFIDMSSEAPKKSRNVANPESAKGYLHSRVERSRVEVLIAPFAERFRRERIPQEDFIPPIAFDSHHFPTPRHYFLALEGDTGLISPKRQRKPGLFPVSEFETINTVRGNCAF